MEDTIAVFVCKKHFKKMPSDVWDTPPSPLKDGIIISPLTGQKHRCECDYCERTAAYSGYAYAELICDL